MFGHEADFVEIVENLHPYLFANDHRSRVSSILHALEKVSNHIQISGSIIPFSIAATESPVPAQKVLITGSIFSLCMFWTASLYLKQEQSENLDVSLYGLKSSAIP